MSQKSSALLRVLLGKGLGSTSGRRLNGVASGKALKLIDVVITTVAAVPAAVITPRTAKAPAIGTPSPGGRLL
jgi:hypothetical protein